MIPTPDLYDVCIFVVISFVWSEILTMPSHVFSLVGDWLETLPTNFGKPLGLCSICFGGQIAFNFTFWRGVYFGYYPFFEAVLSAIITIFCIYFLLKINNKWLN